MKCLTCGHDNPGVHQFCGGCGTPLTASTGIGAAAVQDNSIRYHGLDALRGMAMLLGIVLHAALPYIPNMEAFWPTDESSSHVVNTIFHFIHIWRMPLFFILAGFFANLVISRKSWGSWWGNRLLRIGLPIIVFFPLMSLTIPWIFKYGKTGEFIYFYTNEGQPFHLWFLWHLMIFVIFTAIFRLPYLGGVGVLNSLNRIGLGFIGSVFRKSKSALSGILFRSRFPIVFMIVCSVINLPTGGELIINPIASGLYFAVGYSLYRNSSLFMFLKAHWRYYFLAGIVGFTLYTILNVAGGEDLATDIYSDDITNAVETEKDIIELLRLLQYLSKIICGVLFSYAFIGLAEKKFGAYNPSLRFISDGAYWMYLIHLPVVTLITFFMFNLHIPIEIKFLIAIVMTSIICLGTYKYFVRSTPIGILLNGRRYPLRMTGL
jgi:glucan biosynthesis protein C